MLNDFCDEKGALAKSTITNEFYAKHILANLGARIRAYRVANEPIIWLKEWHEEDDLEFKRFPVHGVKNTWGAQIIDAYNPKTIADSLNELEIRKTRYSGFYGTSLAFQLSLLKPDQVEVGGVCTSICVMDTVGGLANRDHNVTIYRDCVADLDPAAHENALGRMAGLYGAKVI